MHPEAALVLSRIWQQKPSDACRQHNTVKLRLEKQDRFAASLPAVMCMCYSARTWQPHVCHTCYLNHGIAAHAVSIMIMCRGGGQEVRGGRVKELEGQLEEVRSHYHHKLRSLENQLQVITCCYMAAVLH